MMVKTKGEKKEQENERNPKRIVTVQRISTEVCMKILVGLIKVRFFHLQLKLQAK